MAIGDNGLDGIWKCYAAPNLLPFGFFLTIRDRDALSSVKFIRFAGFFLSVVAIVSTCVASEFPVVSYGVFLPGAADAVTLTTNFTTINRAIREVGLQGGGTIKLPAGVFYIGPDPVSDSAAITINFDNVTLAGEGVGRTILRTNGVWNAAALRRGKGIVIQGTLDPAPPRKNVVLRDFELDGQAGWTGDYNWTNPPNHGPNGWDISHKGIIVAQDTKVDKVLLENLYVHRYRGEVLYTGGYGVGKLTVRNVKMADTNASCFNLYAADLLVEKCEFAGPSRFWVEFSTRQNQLGLPVNRAIFRDNNFHNVVDDRIKHAQIVLAQGDHLPYAVTFENNAMRDCPNVFGFFGGTAGPVTIRKNHLTDCGVMLEFGVAPGWINSAATSNMLVEDNTIKRARSLVSLHQQQDNIMIRNNEFTGYSSANSGLSTAVVYGTAKLERVRIESNTFRDCRSPEQTAPLYGGKRPLFSNNEYQNTQTRVLQGEYYLTSANLKVTPRSEFLRIYSDADARIAALQTTQYSDGQLIEIEGGSASKRVRFAPNQPSYQVAANRYLDGANTLRFTYDAAAGKWIEFL